MFTSAAVLDLKNSIFWAYGCLGCGKMSLPAEYGANRTYRFDVILFSVKFTFSSAAILDFEKISLWSAPLSERQQDEAPVKILWQSDQRFGSYSSFCKFLIGAAAILNSVIFKFLVYFLI